VQFGQVSQVQIDDPQLLRAIDLTIDTLAVPKNELGAIVVEISRFTAETSDVEFDDELVGKALKTIETFEYEVKVSFNMNAIVLKYQPPACYFFHHDRLILVYFGIEKFIKVDDNKIDGLRKKMKKYFRNDGGSYTSPACWLKVRGAEVFLLKKFPVSW
jgi:hypothetical protein